MITKNKIILIVFSLVMLLILIDSTNNRATSNATGAPPSRTGSPGDSYISCTDCHSGPTETFEVGWITSNIPPDGYVPGNTYSITTTITRPGHIRFGFEISPQDLNGVVLGTMILTNPVETKLVGGGDYVTHAAGGNLGTGGIKSWSFDWVAPSQGTGDVTFYGAFNAANNNNNSNGDTIFLSQMFVSECQAPTQPGLIMGNISVCSGSTQTYSIDPVANAVSYSWSLPGGWAGSSTDTFITVVTGANSGQVSVSAIGNCSSSADQTLPIIVNTVSVTFSSQNNVSCAGGNNGSLTAVPSGGNSPYTYSWNTTPIQHSVTASALSIGTYTVTVHDAGGCSTSSQATITQPDPIVLNSSSTHSNCIGSNNGTAIVSVVSGGVGPFSYSWNTTPIQHSNTATGLNSGSYVVTVTDANSCTKTSSVTISPSPAIVLTSSQINVSCYGGANGTATAIVSGGTPGFTYSWNTVPVQTTITAVGLEQGAYNCTVTDQNSCSKSITVNIIQPTAALATNAIASNVTCNGASNGFIVTSVSGGTNPYSYSWNTTPTQTNDTALNLSPGNYIVIITDANNCTSTSSATISQPPVISLNIISSDVSCNGGTNGSATANVIGGVPPISYSWNTIPSQSTATVTGLSSGNYTVTISDNHGCTRSSSKIISQPTAINAILSKTNVSCHGGNNGSINVSSSGGIGPYTYTWNTVPVQLLSNITNLISGNYTVTITDANSCTQTSSTIITEPNQIVLQTNSTNAGCSFSNGTASVIASGGNPGFTYSWNTVPIQNTSTINNVAAGTYTVIVTDQSNCTTQSFVTVNNNSGVQLNLASSSDVKCNGDSSGSATVVGVGGIPPYSYSWLTTGDTNNSINGLAAGYYNVTVTDSENCLASMIVTINEPVALVSDAGTQTTICEGDTIFLGGNPTAFGGVGPYTYLWQPSAGLNSNILSNPFANPLNSTIYNLTVLDSNGCLSTSTANIIVNPLPQAPVISEINDTLYCFPGLNCQWYENGILINGADTDFYIPNHSSNYSVTISDSNTCSISSMISSYILSAKMSELDNNTIEIYPNPATNILFINYYEHNSGRMVFIKNIAGENVFQRFIHLGLNEIDISSLKSGLYLIQVGSDGNVCNKFIFISK